MGIQYSDFAPNCGVVAVANALNKSTDTMMGSFYGGVLVSMWQAAQTSISSQRC